MSKSLLEDLKRHRVQSKEINKKIYSVLDNRSVTIDKGEAKSFLIYSFAQVMFGMFIATFFVVMASIYSGPTITGGLYAFFALLSCLALSVLLFYKFVSLIVLSVGRLRDTGLPVWLLGLALLGIPGMAVLTILLFGESKSRLNESL